MQFYSSSSSIPPLLVENGAISVHIACLYFLSCVVSSFNLATKNKLIHRKRCNIICCLTKYPYPSPLWKFQFTLYMKLHTFHDNFWLLGPSNPLEFPITLLGGSMNIFRNYTVSLACSADSFILMAFGPQVFHCSVLEHLDW